jgi:hypothetical protein
MPFTLTLLGTDTEYEKAKVNILDYPLGETLSLVNILLEKQDAISPESEVEHICNPTHTIIDGPKTLGTEVFHRINLGLFRLLNAVHNNQQPLQIIAHSRGACEAILVSHEFDRIKKLLSNYSDAQIESSIDEIKAEFKKNIVKDLIIEPLDEEHFFSVDYLKTIKSNISNSSLSLFLLDPVPGGSYLGIDNVAKAADYVVSSIVRSEKPIVKSLKWDDPLLYTLPESVDYLQQFVYENEHTRCFKPVVPVQRLGMSYYSVQSLPGHHGTGSGNPYDQQKTFRKPEYDIAETLGVQKLIFSKLINFLKNQGHTFEFEACPAHSRPLAEVAKIVMDADEGQFRTHLIEMNRHIHQHIQSYERFNKTAYAYLGQEHGLSSFSENTKRVIHHGSEKDSFLFDALPSGRTKGFLNWEHIELEMQARLSQDFNHSNPIQCIRSLKEAIEAPTEEFIKLKNELLIAVINNLSHAFISDELKLSRQQISEFLSELDSLMVILKSKPDDNESTIIENSLATYINKKADRLTKNAKKQFHRRDEDIETLKSLLTRDDLTLEDKTYIESNLLILQKELPIRESAHPATQIGHQASEILKQWSTEEELKYNQLTLQELCKNYKKLLELQKIITHFVGNDVYDSRKFSKINMSNAFNEIRGCLFGHIKKNDISLTDVKNCIQNEEAYQSFAKWLIREVPGILQHEISEPLHFISIQLTLLQKQTLTSSSKFNIDQYYQPQPQQHKSFIQYHKDNIEKFKADAEFLCKYSQKLNQTRSEQKERQIKYAALEKELFELTTYASRIFSFVPGLSDALEQKNRLLQTMKQLLKQAALDIESEFQKVHHLGQLGSEQLAKYQSDLQRYQNECISEVSAKKQSLFPDIDKFEQQPLLPIDLINHDNWAMLGIQHLSQVMQDLELFMHELKSMTKNLSEITTQEALNLKLEIQQNYIRLIEKQHQAEELRAKLSSLHEIYRAHPVLSELEALADYSPQMNKTDYLQSARQYELALQQQIDQYQALIGALETRPKFPLLTAKIAQDSKTLADSQQKLSDLVRNKHNQQQRLMELSIEKNHLFAEIEAFPHYNMPNSLGDDPNWFDQEIQRLNQDIQQMNIYIQQLEAIRIQISHNVTHESLALQNEIDQRVAQLSEQRQETEAFMDRLSQLHQVYLIHPLHPRLAHLQIQSPVYPQVVNLENLNHFHQQKMAFQESARQHEQALHQQIAQYQAVIDRLRVQPEFALLHDKISQLQQIIDIDSQHLIQLSQQILTLANDEQAVTDFYDQWLKQLRDQTFAYQAHLNHQHSSSSTTLLNRKKVIVNELLEQLNTPNQPAYVNIHQFQQLLDTTKNELSEHRDPSWQRYLAIVAKCALVFAIIAGSVMLGLTNGLALGIAIAALCTLSIGITAYKKYQAHENLGFFASKGHMFVDSVNKVPSNAG